MEEEDEIWMEDEQVKEVERLERLIKEDNVEELSNILNSSEILRNNFNTFFTTHGIKTPLLHVAVNTKSHKVVEYLLSQDFVDKGICNSIWSENIYHVICRLRGVEELFSIIEKNVPHNLLLNHSHFKINAFQLACQFNNIFIVKRVYEILESLQTDLTLIKNASLEYAFVNQDVEVVKYILSIDGIQLKDKLLFTAIGLSKFDIIVYLLNVYLWQSIPSHLHNQFHIFQFSNNHYHNNNHILNPIHYYKNKNRIQNDNNSNIANNNNDLYLKLVEENCKKFIDLKCAGNRIWHEVCYNKDMDVVKLIFSLKGIRPKILNGDGYNVFLLACEFNANIKVIKYIHKLFPSLINSQINIRDLTGDQLVLYNYNILLSEQLKLLHYLYLNGIDIHNHNLYVRNKNSFAEKGVVSNIIYQKNKKNIIQYLKVISQDFDYQNNEHDEKEYRKPSFWKEIDDNSADEQSKRRNEWKNRFEEHVLHHFSKMIQQYMINPNQ